MKKFLGCEYYYKAAFLFKLIICAFLQPVTLYGSSMLGGSAPAGQALEIEGASQPGLVTKSGLVLYGTDGNAVSSPSPRLNKHPEQTAADMAPCSNKL